MIDSVLGVSCIHDGSNLSDHSPIVLKLNINVFHSAVVPKQLYIGFIPNWDAATFDDLFLYKVVLDDLLNPISVPLPALTRFACSGGTMHEGHCRGIEDYLNALIDCSMRAAKVAIPGRRRRKRTCSVLV
jgi:hypothetical protein